MKSWQPDTTKTSGWGNYKQPGEIDYGPMLCPFAPVRRTIILQRLKELLNPTNTSLFDMLPLYILAAIYT